ncbi:hypothetical protein NQZ68_014220 [Dissostichus eleginoides]|nr:hypothetical protein NQZ68_014220 [Dissostichus eleginoides]
MCKQTLAIGTNKSEPERERQKKEGKMEAEWEEGTDSAKATDVYQRIHTTLMARVGGAKEGREIEREDVVVCKREAATNMGVGGASHSKTDEQRWTKGRKVGGRGEEAAVMWV